MSLYNTAKSWMSAVGEATGLETSVKPLIDAWSGKGKTSLHFAPAPSDFQTTLTRKDEQRNDLK